MFNCNYTNIIEMCNQDELIRKDSIKQNFQKALSQLVDYADKKGLDSRISIVVPELFNAISETFDTLTLYLAPSNLSEIKEIESNIDIFDAFQISAYLGSVAITIYNENLNQIIVKPVEAIFLEMKILLDPNLPLIGNGEEEVSAPYSDFFQDAIAIQKSIKQAYRQKD